MHPRCKTLPKGSWIDRLVKSNLRWEGIVFSLGVIHIHGPSLNQTLDFSNGPQKLEAHLFDVKEDLGHDGRELVARYLTTKSDVNIEVQNLNSTPALSFKVEAKGIGTLALTNVSARVQGKLLTGAADYSITISEHTYLRFTSNQLIYSFSRTSYSHFQAGNNRGHLRRSGWRR